MAVARDLKGDNNNVICVIGDGSMSAGMAYEAMNNAGARDERLIVILNDNEMSIAPPTGALSKYLTRATSSGPYLHLRDFAKQLAKRLPKKWERRAARVEEMSRTIMSGGNLVRGTRLLLRRPHRRTRLGPAPARAEERPRCRPGSDPRSRHHQEGQRLRPCRSLRR